jgi:hypothetical protein
MMLPAPGFIRRKALVAPQNERALGPLRACSLTTYSLGQPEVTRESSSLAPPLVPTHREPGLTGRICRGVNALRGAMRPAAAWHRSPQMLHRLPRRRRPWEAAPLKAQRFGTLPTGGRRGWGATLCAEDEGPSRPVPTPHRPQSLLRRLLPRLRQQAQHPATPDREDPMEDTTRRRARPRHLDLLTTMPRAGDAGGGSVMLVSSSIHRTGW